MVRINRFNPSIPDVVTAAALAAACIPVLVKVPKAPKARKLPPSSHEENSVNLYFDQIKRLEKLTLGQEVSLSARIKAGDHAAMQILVKANLKFVVAVCKNYRNQGMAFGDLINEGNVGLIKAANRFDANSGCRFISYAVWWIRQGILTALAEQGRFMNISSGRIGMIRQVAKATKTLTQKLGREPFRTEVAESLGRSEEVITECLMLTYPTKSLSTASNGDGHSLEDTLGDEVGDPTDFHSDHYLLEKAMEKVLSQLDGRKAQVLRMTYGIGCGSAYTLKEISEKMGLSRERIRQIKSSTLELLRHPAKRKVFGI